MKTKGLWKYALMLTAILTAAIILPVKAQASEPAYVEAETTSELMEAMGDDVVIVLQPGTYNVTEWLLETEDVKEWHEGEKEAGVYTIGNPDEPGLLIGGFDNLTIVSADRENPAEIVSTPRQESVLYFMDCENIILNGLVMGHTPEKGSCDGDVVMVADSEHILLSDCELYGCGAYALGTYSCEDVTMLDCDVHDCTYGCVSASVTERLRFIRTDFHDCGQYTMFKLNGTPAAFIDCKLRNLQGTFTDTELPMTYIEIENCFDGYGVVNPAEPEKTEEGGLISYTVKSHPKELKDGDASLAIGNYYEILLSEEDKEAYPRLSEVIDRENKSEDERLTESLSANEEDIFELRDNSGMDFNFEYDSFYYPQRTDSHVFSYAVMDYTYLGGAHGVSAYRCYNIDPKTGKAIPLTDVVKNPDNLPAVVLEELKESPEYGDYYEDNESAEQTFYDSMQGLLEKDGEKLRWTLDYDKMYVYFNDYELGPYAMGAPRVSIPFSEHAELFSDSFIYSGEIPEGNSNMTFVSDAPKETIKSERHETALLPLYWGSAPFWPEKEEDYGDGYSYSTYTDLYETDPGEYPLLSKALDDFNEQNKDTYEEWLPLLKDQIDRLYMGDSDQVQWPSFAEEGIFSLCRADEAVLSFVKYQNFSGIGNKAEPESYAQGINFDPKTGKSVDLYEVITSKEEFLKAFEEELSETDFYVEDWKEVADRQVTGALADSVIYSGAESGLSFTIDYNGLTLYFNGSDTGYDDGPCTILLSFSEYPELFQEKYTTIPENYCSELMTGDFEYVYWYDFDGDGEAEPVSLIREDSEWEYWYSYSMRWGDTVFELSEVGNFYYASPFLVHDRGRDYLYICATTENDYEDVHVYEITTEAVNYLGAVGGAIKFNTYAEEEGEPIGYLPIDPRSFKMDTVDYTLGTSFLTGDYEVGSDGLPDQIGYYLDYTNTDYWSIKAAKDIEAEYTEGIVEPEEWTEDTPAAQYQRGTIKKGTYVQLYRLGLGNELLLKTKDGKVFRLMFTEGEDGYPYYYEGEELDDLFEGQIYAG